MTYRAVLFDLDGTLLDTVADLANSMNDVLRRSGFPAHPNEAYKYFVGDGIEVLVHKALPETHRDEASMAQFVAAMREEYGKRWDEETTPYPGIPELLDAVAARGLEMAVLSNKPDDFTRAMVAKLLPRWRFAAVHGARKGVPRKPDPMAALDIANRLAVLPGEFLYLGDTGTDMQTAVAAGMYPVGVSWGFRPVEELLANGAAVLIDRPEEMLDLL